ncbi:hypothetical protein [Agromyces aureus]|uniref:Uncharacterized protein n=1 Tax=Agromyces aureus TaxID=453304 RepID=A0A191WF73_9MICO|nr:hypothetical protein [Agromyces aureus]ANJ26829.1 hypothetical protein ATC03_08955 [Agromyces aureus]
MTHNPFAGVRITGTWEDHASYSAGGTDLPLGYDTAIPAPASGTLRTSGGSGEWACGWVGSAGRRSILTLDTPLPRRSPRRSSPSEAEGPMVAIVLQHQSAFAGQGWHPEGAIIGRSGASANGKDYGGDIHLHWHGLDAQGRRLRIESFLNGASTAGGGTATIPDEAPKPPTRREGDTMPTFIRTAQHGHYSVAPGVVVGIGNPNFIDSAVYVAAQVPGGPLPIVYDVAPDDLANFIYGLSGCPATHIPAPNYAWYAAIAYAKTTPEGDSFRDLGPGELDELASKVRAAIIKPL